MRFMFCLNDGSNTSSLSTGSKILLSTLLKQATYITAFIVQLVCATVVVSIKFTNSKLKVAYKKPYRTKLKPGNKIQHIVYHRLITFCKIQPYCTQIP